MSESLVERVLGILDPTLDAQDEVAGMRSDQMDSEADDGIIHFSGEEQAQSEAIPLVHAQPRDMEQAHVVAEEIKRHVPVVLNLADTDGGEANRICDFLYGVTYGMNGKMEQLAADVYACAPFDMPIEKLDVEDAFPGETRYEPREEYDSQPQVF